MLEKAFYKYLSSVLVRTLNGYSLLTVTGKGFLLNNDCLTKQIIKQPQAKIITDNFLET